MLEWFAIITEGVFRRGDFTVSPTKVTFGRYQTNK
jgi:hypothetical protein